MRSKALLAVAGLVAVLLILAGGVFAYDSSRDDLIAPGITVGGVDVGGLRADAARKRLARDLVRPLSRPVVAHHGDHTFTLSPEEAGVGVDVDGSVSAAIERSRSGGILARTYRGLTGGRVDERVDVEITYDRGAVRRLVQQVRKDLEHPARDASIDFSGGEIAKQPSREGRSVAVKRLRRDLTASLTSPAGSRSVRIRTRSIHPAVTTDQLADRYPTIVIVNRGTFRLRLYKRLELVKTYKVAVGKAGLETPQGLYKIENKQVDPYWHVPNSDWAGELAGKVIPPGPENPLKARWMGIYAGAGIHGTDALSSLGTAASHGCIRMAIPDVEDLYERVEVGTPVYIV